MIGSTFPSARISREGRARLHARTTTVSLAGMLVVGASLAAPTLALADAQAAAARVYSMSPGRIGALVAMIVGVIGVVSGGRALARRAGADDDPRDRARTALVLGSIGIVVGALVAATAAGGVGTGNGFGGAVVAIVIGAIATSLGALALVRARRTA